ncbi:MAG: CopD family protein [Thermoleophilia bacterium]
MRHLARLAGLLAAFAALALPATAAAHAGLRTAEPPPGAQVAAAPASVRVVLSSPVEGAFLRMRVTAAGGRVVSGPARRDPLDDRALIAPLRRAAAAGPLTVEWRVLSRDGHPTGGRFGLGVGAAAPAVEGGGVVRDDHGPFPVLARLLALAGPLAALGLLALAVGVVGPALRAGGIRVPGEGAARAESFRAAAGAALEGRSRAWWTALWAAIATQFLGLLLTPAALLRGLREGPGELGTLLGDTAFGTAWRAQVIGLALLLGGALVVRLAVTHGGLPLLPGFALLGLGPVVSLWGISDGGHAATGGDATANVVIDLVHELATAAWLGGLVGLAVLAIPAAWALAEPDRVRLAAAVVVRFSALALTAVALLVVTGVYRALAEVSVDELVDTGYGRALLVKLALFAVLLVGGAYNRMVIHPRLERAALGLDPDDRGAAAALRVSVKAELAVAALLMVSVAVLISLPPPG